MAVELIVLTGIFYGIVGNAIYDILKYHVRRKFPKLYRWWLSVRSVRISGGEVYYKESKTLNKSSKDFNEMEVFDLDLDKNPLHTKNSALSKYRRPN